MLKMDLCDVSICYSVIKRHVLALGSVRRSRVFVSISPTGPWLFVSSNGPD